MGKKFKKKKYKQVSEAPMGQKPIQKQNKTKKTTKTGIRCPDGPEFGGQKGALQVSEAPMG